MLKADRATARRARTYKEEFLRKHFGVPKRARFKKGRAWPSIAAWDAEQAGVLGVGFGIKEVGQGGVGAAEALRIYVRRKLPNRRIRSRDRIPPEIGGLPTDVIEVGDIKAYARPASGGSSGASERVLSGTLGCLVRSQLKTERQFILSCSHALANEGNCVVGDRVLEPSRNDGGSVSNPIGFLRTWSKFLLESNVIDAALADLSAPGVFTSQLRYLGQPNRQPVTAYRDMSVKKSGRNAPFVTLGVVSDVSADINVNFQSGRYGFVNQIAIRGVGGAFSGEGDSGSLVVEAASLSPVALLFAGGEGITFANPIQRVFSFFGIEMA